jgi:hypothetical protein
MGKIAERLRILDERRFQDQIAKIEECLHRDATWDLNAALTSCDRWREWRSEKTMVHRRADPGYAGLR